MAVTVSVYVPQDLRASRIDDVAKELGITATPSAT